MIEYRELVPVLEAPMTRVFAARSALAANGIASFILNENTKTTPPPSSRPSCLCSWPRS